LLSLAVALLASCAGAEVQATAAYPIGGPTSRVSVDLFYDTLLPYGRWLERPGVGWVWAPNAAVVGADFIPYATAGRWDYSSLGWMFVSDWDWGWAPFHYGRWYIDPLYGWVWVPDSIWGPAWVDWRIGGGLIAWAPLPPRFHRVPDHDRRTRWCFVNGRDFRRPVIGRHLLAPNGQRLAMTTPSRRQIGVGAHAWLAGPSREGVETATHTRVSTIQVTAPRPGVVTRMNIEGNRAIAVPMRARRPSRTGARAPMIREPGAMAAPRREPGSVRRGRRM
jgi:hypothetical protein